MATFGQITDEVSRKLAGFTLRQDRQTHLKSNITSSTLSIPVASAQNISAGIIQIDNELIYIDSFDRVSNILTAAPYGRGYNGTTVSTHSANAKVVISPAFPILDIKASINETLQATFPTLYVINTHTFTYHPAQNTYALPDDARKILSVSYESIGPSKEWLPVRSYRIDNMANQAKFNSRNTISLYSGVFPGRTVQVYYSSPPAIMQSESDDFETTTGLPDSCKDVIVFGSQYRMVSQLDPARLSFGSAEANQQNEIAGRSYGSGINSAKYLLALYQQRLEEEGRKLDEMNPIRVHYSK